MPPAAAAAAGVVEAAAVAVAVADASTLAPPYFVAQNDVHMWYGFDRFGQLPAGTSEVIVVWLRGGSATVSVSCGRWWRWWRWCGSAMSEPVFKIDQAEL